MRRGAGLAVIAAAAALGVGTAVVAGVQTGVVERPVSAAGDPAQPSAAVTGGGTGTSPTSRTPATTPASGSPTSSPRPTTAATTSPAASSATASRPTRPSGTATVTVTGQLRTSDLLQKLDFAAVGWSTTNLDISLSEGGGQSVVGMCSQSALGGLEGAGAPVRGDYYGSRTSAEELAVTFRSEADAALAFDTVHRWLTECRLGTPSGAGAGGTITVGPDVPVYFDDAHDTGVWADTDDKADGVAGAMGVLVVANRLAVIQIFDDQPKATTVDDLMVAAAKRLAP